jgi:hypothetical protein
MRHNKRLWILVLGAFFLTLSSGMAGAQEAASDIVAKQIITQVNGQRAWKFTRDIASPEFGGRLAGTEDEFMAAEFISRKFEIWGLEPAGDDGTYYQSFTLSSWYATAPVNLALEGGPTYEYGTDYRIFTYSGSVDVTAEVVFAGYGITVPPYNQADYPDCTAPTAGYDDYASLDVADKIVLVLRHGPNDDPDWYYEDCPTNIPEAAGSWAFGYKSLNARLHGAEAMILVNDYNHDPGVASGTLNSYAYLPDMGAVRADRAIGETLVPDLEARQAIIDSTLDPTLATGPTGQSMHMLVTASFNPEAQSQNVLGVIPGSDPEVGNEVVVISAHYDHVGVSPTGEVFSGADDDASGVAVMMELAKVMASGNFSPKRTILFAAWGAEEAGLLGSEYYVEQDPKYPLEDTVAVLQMDMIGVGDSTGVNVSGGVEFPDLFNQIAANANELFLASADLTSGGRSDHAPFINAGVPAVMFQTMGPHLYYHTPADSIDTIDRFELELTGRVVGATAYEIAMDETFVVSRPTGFLLRHFDDAE